MLLLFCWVCVGCLFVSGYLHIRFGFELVVGVGGLGLVAGGFSCFWVVWFWFWCLNFAGWVGLALVVAFWIGCGFGLS